MTTQYGDDDMRVLDSVLGFFKEPAKVIKYRLEESTHDELYSYVEYSPEDDLDGVYNLYRIINDYLISLSFKIKIIYSAWADADVVFTDEEIRFLTIGINYEIHESVLQLLKLGTFYLPYLKRNQFGVEAFKSTVHQYIRKANCAFPERFGIANKVSFNKPIHPEEALSLSSGKTYPNLSYEPMTRYYLDTDHTEESIHGRVAYDGVAPSIHPNVSQVMKLCKVLDWAFEYLPPHQIMEESDHVVQEVILCLLTALTSWQEDTLTGLLKDDQALHREYNGMVKREQKVLPYHSWRESQLIAIVEPCLSVCPTLC